MNKPRLKDFEHIVAFRIAQAQYAEFIEKENEQLRAEHKKMIDIVYHHFWDEPSDSSSRRKDDYKSMRKYAKNKYDESETV